MSGRGESLLEALGPVCSALLEDARADATRLEARAESEAVAELERARALGDAIAVEARERGEREAGLLLAAEQARSARRKRAAELAARRAAYDALRERVAQLLRQRCEGPDRERVARRMSARVRQVLGPDATVRPAPGGGVIGHAAGRFVDCSVDALAEQSVEQLGAEVEQLWRP